jgi:Kef-type K+ transport system membrane component KefB
MSPSDHNRSLVIIHSIIGALFTCGLLASPLIIAKNFRRPEQMPDAVVVFGLVFLIALLFWSTAIALHLKKSVAKKLALISAAVTLVFFWPAAIYTWWFMHSEGAKQMYGVKRE